MMLQEDFQIREDMVFKLSQKRSPSEVKLRSFEWAIITQLNGEKTVGQIGEILALTPEESVEMFTRLMNEGLLELVGMPDSDPFVPPEVLEELEYQYTLCLGPVASILLDDTLAELKRTTKNLEKKQLPLLIELLSLEISDDGKRHQFQKSMLTKIKGFFNG